MRKQINHVSHVCFVFKKENLVIAMKKFQDAFNITDWDGPQEFPAFGVVQAQSVSAGIEIMAPLDDGDNPFAEHIRQKGEGFFALIYGVEDLHKAAKMAQEKGIELQLGKDGRPIVYDSMVMHGDYIHKSWPTKMKTYREIPFSLFGINFFLGQIEPLQED